MKYLIGIDGGGSNSRYVVCDTNAKVLYHCRGGATNFLKYDVNDVCKTIYTLINKCTKNLKITSKDIKAVVIGTAGAGRREDALYLKKNLKKFFKSKNISLEFEVFSDGNIALEGAFAGQEGSIIISGTGSIIFGKGKDGKIYRLGGYGNKIGDEGSGYSIARKGLNAASQDFDGRGGKTLLTNYLKRNFKIVSGPELVNKIYRKNFDIASFAPFVLKAADRGDKISVEILNDEADELIKHIKAMKKLIGVRKLKVAFSGSLISNKNYFSDLLRKKVKSHLRGIEIVEPKNPPEIGAILLAKKYLSRRS